jgi:hypothetical protein
MGQVQGQDSGLVTQMERDWELGLWLVTVMGWGIPMEKDQVLELWLV